MKKIAILMASLMLVACASTKPATTSSQAPAQQGNAVAQGEATAGSATQAEVALTPEQAAAAKQAAELQRLHNESVFFDYDKFNVKTEFRDTIEKHAAELKGKKAPVVLEGNCDERGSAAYNLALGERRSTSVKKALVLMGVPASSIKVVSYGFSRPELTCHDESCWKENRRVDFATSKQ